MSRNQEPISNALERTKEEITGAFDQVRANLNESGGEEATADGGKNSHNTSTIKSVNEWRQELNNRDALAFSAGDLTHHDIRAATTGSARTVATLNDMLTMHKFPEGPTILVDPKGEKCVKTTFDVTAHSSAVSTTLSTSRPHRRTATSPAPHSSTCVEHTREATETVETDEILSYFEQDLTSHQVMT